MGYRPLKYNVVIGQVDVVVFWWLSFTTKHKRFIQRLLVVQFVPTIQLRSS